MIRLPRYQLTFKLKGGKWVWEENPKYSIDLGPDRNRIRLDDLQATLHLVSDKNEKIVLVPKQRFRRQAVRDPEGTPTRITLFQDLIYDTANRHTLHTLSQQDRNAIEANPARAEYTIKRPI